MDLHQLNERSRDFAEALLREFPEWAPHLELATFAGAEPGTLMVEVPPPHAGGSPLYIDTANDEITVEFAGWHEHYGTWTGEDEEQVSRAVLDDVRSIVEERLLSVLAMDGEKWRRSWSVAPGEPVDTRHGERTVVRSWRGTYDAELTRG